jgi:hypothetical protein
VPGQTDVHRPCKHILESEHDQTLAPSSRGRDPVWALDRRTERHYVNGQASDSISNPVASKSRERVIDLIEGSPIAQRQSDI